MRKTQPLISLHNDVKMPMIGYGVFQIPAKETAELVKTAIQTGYRLIDTAAAYRNEAQVGKGLQRSGIARSELFVTTKLWISDFGYDEALKGFDASRRKLGLDYVDLYLLHWPVPTKFNSTIASYQALEKLLADGLVRAIGVSNFTPANLETLIKHADIIPAVNQIELHPYFSQKQLRETHSKLGIVTQAWSPIGGVLRYSGGQPDTSKTLLKNPTIIKLAEKYAKTPAQIILRWHVDHGIAIIPKSVHPSRIAENLDILDFSLNEEDIVSIDSLNLDLRGGPDPDTFGC